MRSPGRSRWTGALGLRTDGRVIDTAHFVRFERVSSLEVTEHGLEATLHGEQLRVDVVRDDVIRVTISRGGVFDESPTFAVCVDPLSESVDFAVEHSEGVVRLRTSALVASLGLDPFRLDVHRASRYLLTTTPMDRIPIYARAGAVIPMWPEAPESTAGYHPSAIELHVFVPDADGTHRSLLQEDDGLSFAALEGARYRTTFEVTRSGNRVALRAEADGHGYPEFGREALRLVIHRAAPPTVVLDGIEGADPRRARRDRQPGGGFTVDFDV